MTHDAFQTLIDLCQGKWMKTVFAVLLFSDYKFLPRRPLHWFVDGDVRNKAITSENGKAARDWFIIIGYIME